MCALRQLPQRLPRQQRWRETELCPWRHLATPTCTPLPLANWNKDWLKANILRKARNDTQRTLVAEPTTTDWTSVRALNCPLTVVTKSYVTRPRYPSPLVMPATAGSRATVAEGECPAPLNNQNPWLRVGKPRQKNPGPPGWGLDMGLITPPRKTTLLTETGISRNTVYNGCSTTTCRTPDHAFITWIYGAMTTMSETRNDAHSLNKSLADPKTKVKIGCWNVRTTFSVGKTAQMLSEWTTTHIQELHSHGWRKVKERGVDRERHDAELWK